MSSGHVFLSEEGGWNCWGTFSELSALPYKEPQLFIKYKGKK
jgi:hypothetical protein